MASATGGSAHPLRPYYTDDKATFTAHVPHMSSQPGASPGNAASGGAPSRSGWGSKGSSNVPLPPTNNRYKSATSALDDDAMGGGAGSGNSYYAQLSDATSALVYSAGLQYASTCLAMPFEVGKLLLQVQWVPKDEVWMAFGNLEREEEMKQLRANRERQQRRAPRVPLGRNEWVEGADYDEEGRIHGGSFPTSEDADIEEGDEDEDEEDDYENIGASSRPDFGAENDELSDEDDAEAYFRDLSNTSSRPLNVRGAGGKRRKPTDSYGYVMRKSIHEDTTRPEFVMPVVVRGGVWEMIKAVGRGKEGWLGLWKGTFTTFVIDVATSTIQPLVSSILSIAAPSALTLLPLPYAPHPYRSLTLLATSHLLTGIVVSPLDLVRTRLIAQSTLPAHRKYTTPWNALSQILEEEGGWKTTYLHPNLFIPTLLDYTFRPLLTLSAPLLIEHNLKLDPITNPVSYSLAEFCISSASLLLTLPIETVRRRLQIQSRTGGGDYGQSSRKINQKTVAGSSIAGQAPAFGGTVAPPLLSRPLRTCVETRPRPYVGVVEAIWRIVTEESSTSPVVNKKSASSSSSREHTSMHDSGILAKQGHSSLGGLYSLYRGFGFAIGANALVFVLTVVTGERASSTAGWAEI